MFSRGAPGPTARRAQAPRVRGKAREAREGAGSEPQMVKQHTSSGGSAKLLVAKDLAVRHLEAHITRGMHLRRQKLQNLQDLEKARAVKQAWVTGYTTLLKRLFEGNAVADACNDWVGKIFPEYAH